MRSISRAVGRRDLQLARRVASATELGAMFANISEGIIAMKNEPAVFAALASQLYLDFDAATLSRAASRTAPSGARWRPGPWEAPE
eukprot:7451545-Pyramimonas_sp.AAC.1